MLPIPEVRLTLDSVVGLASGIWQYSPALGGSSGILNRNLSTPDLNFRTEQPVMLLTSYGSALKVLGSS